MSVPILQVRRLLSNSERIGMGFNSSSGLAVGTPFDLDSLIVEADPAAPGQTVFAPISEVNSHDELMNAMDLSVDAQGRYAFFSAGLKSQFSEVTTYNSTSTFLVVKVLVQNPLLRGRNFQLTSGPSGAQGILAIPGTGIAEFGTAFGDSFVRGLQTGGEFYAVIRITSMLSSKERDLSATFQAEYNGLIAEGAFKVAFDEANRSDSTRTEFNATMYQRAGIGEEISPTVDIPHVFSRVKQFPSIVFAHPVAYEIEVATYDTLPLPLQAPQVEADFLDSLRDAQGKKLHYMQVKNDLEFARFHPAFFGDLPTDAVLQPAIVIYTELINAVMSHGEQLATGQMNPPRMFDPMALDPPLAEPAPIALVRVTAPSVVMPNLVGVDVFTMSSLLTCLDHGGELDACLAGTAFGTSDGNPDPISIQRDIAEFLDMSVSQTLRVTWIPGQPDDVMLNLPGPSDVEITSQFPPPGTMVSLATEIIVEMVVTPIIN